MLDGTITLIELLEVNQKTMSLLDRIIHKCVDHMQKISLEGLHCYHFRIFTLLYSSYLVFCFGGFSVFYSNYHLTKYSC